MLIVISGILITDNQQNFSDSDLESEKTIPLTHITEIRKKNVFSKKCVWKMKKYF